MAKCNRCGCERALILFSTVECPRIGCQNWSALAAVDDIMKSIKNIDWGPSLAPGISAQAHPSGKIAYAWKNGAIYSEGDRAIMPDGCVYERRGGKWEFVTALSHACPYPRYDKNTAYSIGQRALSGRNELIEYNGTGVWDYVI